MVELEFNFIGVNAADFRGAVAFYTDVLGVRPAEPTSPDESDSWAMLVAGWDDSPILDGHGLRCELFERDADPPDERWWGRNQNVRPSIQVADLPATEAELHERGVSFTEEIEDTGWEQSIEFTAHDGVRWSLAHAPNYPAGQSVRTPFLGWAELKSADLNKQQDFYTQIMGLTVSDRSASRVRLEQGAAKPLLFLEPGGERVTAGKRWDSPFDVQPVWLSFETPDITEATAWLTDHGISPIRDVESHEWGGTDVIIQDADGNPLQVVEYHDA
jgi:catechol 2,3-dioxygenase-like lactoylglutathione lyase family enzyme